MDCLGGSIFHGWRIQALYECDIPTRKLPRRRLCKSFEFMRHMTLVCVTHFGGDISHLHCLVLDGVYRTNANGQPEFIEIPAPSDEDIWEVLQRRIKRVMKQLVRRGILVEDQGETYLADDVADSKEARVLRPLQKGSCVYRIAFGPRAGQKVLTLQGALPREARGKQRLCANLQGFSLHAALRCGAGQRKTLERLCRYITRPALANDRVQINGSGLVELKLKTKFQWRLTCPQVMSSLRPRGEMARRIR